MARERLRPQTPLSPTDRSDSIDEQRLLQGRLALLAGLSFWILVAPAPPSVRLGRSLPRDLGAWILSCLAKEPAGRPPSAAAAAETLERCAVGAPWSTKQAREWWAERGRALCESRADDAEPSGLTRTFSASG